MVSQKEWVAFDYDHILTLDPNYGELYWLNDRAIYALSRVSSVVFWGSRWYGSGTRQQIKTIQWEVYNQMSTPAHLDDLVTETARAATALEGILNELQTGSNANIASILSDIFSTMLTTDSRFATLNLLVDSIDDVLGGTYEP